MSTQDKNLTRAILDAIDVQPGIKLAILFGSLADSREQAGSDLDLVIDAGHCLTADEKLSLTNKLAERTGRPVDLVDLHTVGEPLLGQILRHGKKLFESGTCYATLSAGISSIRQTSLPIAQEFLLSAGGHGSGSNRTET